MKFNLLKWLGLVPSVLALVDEVARDLKDGALSPEEIKAIGAKLVAIVSSAV